MKNLKYLYLLLLTPFLFTACNLNSEPEFNDKDAFAAFRATSASVAENGGELKIPVLLTSLSGIETTVDFQLNDSTAIQGLNFELINESNSLTFTKDNPIQYITIKPIDNDEFGGDVVFTVNLVNPKGVNLGRDREILVRITDNEHPLVLVLGAFTARGVSYFNGNTEWDITIEKDDKDLNTVWISNLVPGGTNQKIYGTVNAEKTVLSIPVKQVIAVSASYPKILLEGFYGPDGEEDILDGGSITGLIDENGTITLQDEIGSAVYFDAEATQMAGFYNVFEAFVKFTKK